MWKAWPVSLTFFSHLFLAPPPPPRLPLWWLIMRSWAVKIDVAETSFLNFLNFLHVCGPKILAAQHYFFPCRHILFLWIFCFVKTRMIMSAPEKKPTISPWRVSGFYWGGGKDLKSHNFEAKLKFPDEREISFFFSWNNTIFSLIRTPNLLSWFAIKTSHFGNRPHCMHGPFWWMFFSRGFNNTQLWGQHMLVENHSLLILPLTERLKHCTALGQV